MPHQFGFFLSTVLTSGWRVTSEYGPVPLASRAVIMSSLRGVVLRLLAPVLLAPCLGQDVDRRDVLEFDRVGAVGRELDRQVVDLLRHARALAYARSCDVSERARSKLNTTSSAVNGVPSWNLTPGRSLKRQVVGLTCVHDSASDGMMPELLVALDQELVDQAVDVVGQTFVLRMRIRRLHVAAAGPAQRDRIRGDGREAQAQDSDGDGATGRAVVRVTHGEPSESMKSGSARHPRRPCGVDDTEKPDLTR